MKKGFKVLLALALIAVLAIPSTFSVSASNDYDEQKLKSEFTVIVHGNDKDDELRMGRTQIWEQSGTIYGGHETESTINEDSIWVDGGLKVDGEGYSSTNQNHTSGFWAYCSTSMANRPDTQLFIALSWHYFDDAEFGSLDGQTGNYIYA